MSDSIIQPEPVWNQLRERLSQWQTSLEDRQTSAVAVAERMARRAQALRQRREGSDLAQPQQSWLTFLQGHSQYAVPVENVLEVLPLEHIARVMGTPPWILGAVQRRGEILSLIDLGRLFEVPEAGLADLHLSLIVEAMGQRVAIAAADVENVISLSAADMRPAPDFGDKIPNHWLRGVHGESRLLLQLDQILSDSQMTDWREPAGIPTGNVSPGSG